MARRKRRGRFNRIKPDMGWWVDQGSMEFIHEQPNGTSGVWGTAETIMQFNDITDDDSLILRDNSDWFIKRVLLEAWPRFSPPASGSTGGTDTVRLWTLSIGTIDNDKLAEWVVNQPHTLLEPGGYEMWARMLRTYNKPAYYDWRPKTTRFTASEGALLTTTSTASDFTYRQSMPIYGPSHVEDDFSVSSAGLKPEQSLSIGCSVLNPNSGLGYQWGSGDSLEVCWAVRALLQKRRAA